MKPNRSNDRCADRQCIALSAVLRLRCRFSFFPRWALCSRSWSPAVDVARVVTVSRITARACNGKHVLRGLDWLVLSVEGPARNDAATTDAADNPGFWDLAPVTNLHRRDYYRANKRRNTNSFKSDCAFWGPQGKRALQPTCAHALARR